ncbi:DEAD/DEAH box helicase [Candidatus Sordicultor fermentans]|uniref:DEAD/DEAH box helicase n=1 Tax=Candidatus Sordicultor fermentans TaxID=1953203 RepID=UPI001690857B|nr:DEAD/DEAH box helicase [Candidatus Atribacteria bacterium]
MKEKWESWHLHHLARRAGVFGIEEKFVNILEKAGWYLAKDGNIPPSFYPILEDSFKRLAEIKDFDKTCDEKDCPVCRKIKRDYFVDVAPLKPYELPIELYRWQKEAKKVWWENNGRGVVKVVTGAGKTILALSLISDLYNSAAYKEGGLKTIIIVPTFPLLDQWLMGLLDKLNIPRGKIALFYGKEKEPLEGKTFILYIINSAREHIEKHAQTYFKNDDTFLIADECHRYGSKENSKIFKIKFSYTLGLSATPERFGDLGFEKKIEPNLGKIIYSYSYSDALRDGVIPPYKLVRIKVSLKDEEYLQYEEYTNQINKLLKLLFFKYPQLKMVKPSEFFKELSLLYEKTNDNMITRYTSLLIRRKELIHMSKSKLEALKWLISNEDLKNERVLIFHERIEEAEKIYRYLKEQEFKVGIYHTSMPLYQRLENISGYRKGDINILVSCRALDEGFDVPDSNIGIIVAGTSSVRQWIQRMGRILRKTPGKEFSKIYVIFIDIVERDVFKERELVEFEKEALSVESINLTFK